VVTESGFGEWIRPVRDGGALGRMEAWIAEPLSVVDVHLGERCPAGHQTENWAVVGEEPFQEVRRATWEEVLQAVETVNGTLWPNGFHSGYGRNDRVPEHLLATIRRSLYFVRPEGFETRLAEQGYRKRLRATFAVWGEEYDLVVTDEWAVETFRRKGTAAFNPDEVLLCVSLGEPFKGCAYKLVAGVITPARKKRHCIMTL